MLRIRFHGRGGHGVKTASRILGTAAFLAGFQCQDCPVYGAERRGAAVASFTRFGHEPIRERGIIDRPDLVVIADETLLRDPAADVLRGVSKSSLVVVNRPDGSRRELEQRVACRVYGLDLSTHTRRLLGRGSALSAGLASAAARLTGCLAWADVAEAVHEELEPLHLSHVLLDQNLELARWAYEALNEVAIPWPAGGWEDDRWQDGDAARREPAEPLAVVRATDCIGGAPSVLRTGNTATRRTGAWRVDRPLIDRQVCTRCGLCLAVCPDGALSLDEAGYPVIDYEHCKGCLICLERCPLRAIRSQRETQAW